MDVFMQFISQTFHLSDDRLPNVMPPFILIHFESDLSTKEVAAKLDEIHTGMYMLFDVTKYGETYALNLPPDMQRKIFNEVTEATTTASLETLKAELDAAINSQKFERAAELRDEIAKFKKNKVK